LAEKQNRAKIVQIQLIDKGTFEIDIYPLGVEVAGSRLPSLFLSGLEVMLQIFSNNRHNWHSQAGF